MTQTDFKETTYTRRLERFLEISRLLNSTLHLEELTEVVLRIVTDEVPFDRCTLFVVDPKRKVLRSFIAQGLGQTISLPIGEGLAGTVAATGETLDILDVYNDKRFQRRFDKDNRYQTKDALCVPLLNNHGNVIGVLQLLNRLRPLTDADREFLSSICLYIDLALQNAWSHHELMESQGLERARRMAGDSPARPKKAASKVVRSASRRAARSR
jgi:dual 3',5'-cyclic-AMP and -GMP phosphodiesterase 11